jgi:hypothetical protein
MLRTILLIPVLLGTMAVTASAQATPSDLAGRYICDGVGPDGLPYQAIVEIVKHNDTYRLQWWFESEVVGIGLGIRSGDVLAVMHYSGLPGVVAYRIEQGPRLVGEWTVAAADGVVFSETLTKAPDEIGAPATPGPDKPEPQQRHRQPREAVVAQSRN